MQKVAQFVDTRQIGYRLNAQLAGPGGFTQIDSGFGCARLHSACAVVAIVETDDHEVLRLFDTDGG